MNILFKMRKNLISDVAFLHFTRIAKTNCMSYHKSFKKRYFNFLTKYSFFFHFKQVHWQLGTIQYSEIQWQRMTR